MKNSQQHKDMKKGYKYISLTFIFIFLSSLALANHNTQSSGSWTNNNTWVGNSPPTNPNNTTINIHSSHVVTLSGNFSPRNGVTLNVWGDIEITGNFTVMNQFTVTIHPGGSLIVGGNFTTMNGATFTINGEMAVENDVTVGNGATLNGNGTIYVGGDHNLPGNSTVNVIIGYLPISLLSFDVEPISNKAKIQWSTASEINNDFFTIERSFDGNHWNILAFIQGAGNSNQELHYEYYDENPLDGISYYRLKQTDFDGKYEYFAPVAVNFLSSSGKMEILNVTSNGLSMNIWIRNNDSQANLTVSDIYGRLLYTGNAPVSDYAQQLSIDLPRNYSGEIIVMRLHGQQNSDERKIRVR